MRPLGMNIIGISIYFEYDTFPDDFRQFWRFFLDANGHMDGHTDGRTDPHIEMRGRI